MRYYSVPRREGGNGAGSILSAGMNMMQMLGLTFLFPALLIAAGAVAAPVVIHLILRTKPRRVVFPPLMFVRKTHLASISKLKLRHLLLLLLRAAIVACIAFLIAGPRISNWRRAAGEHDPVAAVIVLDNSGSMTCLDRDRKLIDRAKSLALQVLDALAPGSRAAVITTGGGQVPGGLLADRKLLAQQVADTSDGFGGQSVAGALARAKRLLAGSDIARKQIYLLTDMTARAWRDGAGIGAEGDAEVVILDCSTEHPGNVAIEALHAPALNVPAGVEVELEAVIRADRAAGEYSVRAELDGRAVAQKTASLPAGGSASVRLAVRPGRSGAVHGRVVVQCDDALAMDNARHFTLLAGEPAKMLIVRDPTTVGRGGQCSFLMANAVAPPGAAPGRGEWISRRTITADGLDDEALRDVRIVMLADVSALTDAQWRLLEGFIRAGGRLWVVAGALVSPASYGAVAAQRILPLALGSAERLPQALGWQENPPAHPMLQPFSGEANPPLAEVRCRRRFTVTRVAPEATVVLRYADGVPAVAARTVGGGQVVLWNFSPVREFSNLAGLEQFAILAQRTARLLGGRITGRTDYLWGQSATVGIPDGMSPAATGMVRRPGSPDELPVIPDARTGAVTILADRLGGWTVRFCDDERTVRRGFSVNVDPAESDLSPAARRDVLAMFGWDKAIIASDVQGLARSRRTVARPLDLAAPILLALLVLVTVESFFANRFYKRPPEAPDG